MIHECIFCGSPSAAWPAEASDYVKGYKLCEYHIAMAIDFATQKEYDKKIVSEQDLIVKVNSDLYHCIYETIKKHAEHINPQINVDELGFEAVSETLDRIYCQNPYSAFLQPNYGDPIKTWVDDENVDKWVAKRIGDIAKSGRVYRCSAEKIGSPDNRCTRYAKTENGFCDCCKKTSVKVASGINHVGKLQKALEILRGE